MAASELSWRLTGLIVGSVGLSAVAQIVLKFGMSGAGVQQALKDASGIGAGLVIATNPWVLLGLTLYGLGAAVWLLVLARLDVSMAYPFVGLAFLFTLLFGWLFLGESVGLNRIAGTLLVICGVWLVSRG